MKKFLTILALACSLVAVSCAPMVANVSAKTLEVGDTSVEYDENYTDPSGKIPGGGGSGGEAEVEDRAKIIVEVLATSVGVVSVVMIIWGGIMYSYSGGDPSKAQLARRIIISAIIGLVLSLLAGVILATVVNIAEGGTL